jgi:SM-20-related protein
MISYLNQDWKRRWWRIIDSSKDNNQILHTQGKTVFFKSDELLHEV